MEEARVSLRDMRSALRLIGECRELGADSAAWHSTYRRAVRLVGARSASAGTCSISSGDGGSGHPRVRVADGAAGAWRE
jgi:hypothetical protein